MKKIDVYLLLSVAFLTVFGLFMIYDVSYFIAFRDFSDKYHYVRGQLLWVGIGALGLLLFSNINYHKLYNLSLPLLSLAIALLILVFVPGIGVKLLGAYRWIDARVFLIQPAEFVKLALSIYLAAWFSVKEKGRLLSFLLLLGLVLGLVILEPDMGTTVIILAEALVIYFLSGSNIFYFLAMLPVVLGLGFLLVKFSPYRAKRLEEFFNLNQSFESSSYHVKQILIALGSGGIFGVGLGNSLSKYAYLPETTTDSIFAVIGEELGFLGAAVLVGLFAFIVWRGFHIALCAKDNFGKLLAAGITTFLGTQAIINLAAQTALVPLTGVPLPFISYGGSSLIVDLSAVGILLNISRNS